MKNTSTTLLFGIVLLIGVSGAAQSVPSLINYQGRLTDQTGTPLTNGNYGIQFRLWDSPTASATNDLIWGQQQNVSIQSSGVFSVVLGGAGGSAIPGVAPAVNDLRFAFSFSNCFLGITVISSNGIAIVSPTEILPRSQILSVPFAVSALHGVPPGSVIPFAGTNTPVGWLMCDGGTNSAVNPLYAALFAAIGKIYGPGDGTSLSFRLPDLRGRTAIGAGQGTALTGRTIGDVLGKEFHQLTLAEMPTHSHGVTDPGHSHGYSRVVNGASFGDNSLNQTSQATQTSVDTTGISIQSAGGGVAHTNMPPSLVLNYIIKL